MRLTWLGWAGVELRHDDACIVIDPLLDVAGVFQQAERAGMDVACPQVAHATDGAAMAGLLTHLHRDHADVGALSRALAPGAFVLEPSRPAAARTAMATRQADLELEASGLTRRSVEAWTTETVGPFTVTAVPAVDGLGDPQVSWLVEAGGVRVLHLGDTMYHGHWWRIAEQAGPIDVALLPINGPIATFPHLTPASPLPVAMDPEQAVAAAQILGARLAMPIHHDGYGVDGIYEPARNALSRFRDAATSSNIGLLLPAVAETIELESQ